MGQRYLGARHLVGAIAQNERKLQLTLRAMTNGVITERDRLLQYTVGQVYQELSLFLEETARREKQLKELTTQK